MSEFEEPVSWFIDRTGDPSILSNFNSIHYLASQYIHNYMMNDIVNDLRNDLSNNISNNIGNNIVNDLSNNDIQPTIPFGPELEIEVVENMESKYIDHDCCVCQEDREKTDMCILNCAHLFCCDCVENIMERQKTCPLCRSEISGIYVQNEENREKFMIY